MAINETISTGNKYRRLKDASTKLWQRLSFWTKASDVEFDNGATAETSLGNIQGITDSVNSNASNIAASAAAVNTLNSNITNVSNASGTINVYVDNDGKLHFVNKDGADSVLNFNSGGYVVCNYGLGSLNSTVGTVSYNGTYCTFKGVKSFKFHFYHVRNGSSWVYDNGKVFYEKSVSGQYDSTYEVPNPDEVHTITWKTQDWLVFYISSITWMDGIVD